MHTKNINEYHGLDYQKLSRVNCIWILLRKPLYLRWYHIFSVIRKPPYGYVLWKGFTIMYMHKGFTIMYMHDRMEGLHYNVHALVGPS